MGGNKTRFARAVDFLIQAWLIVGLSVLLFVILEILASGAFAIRNLFVAERVAYKDYRVKAEVYEDVDWAFEYFDEFYQAVDVGNMAWAPYVYWRAMPYDGRLIGIDQFGRRKTWSSKKILRANCDPVRIFMFGGSTMWGTGARDGFTIPSHLAKQLDRDGYCVEITNFGESGYVNTQELFALSLELRAQNAPDIAIFYDGVNDTYSAFQQRVAGLPQNEQNRAAEFNLLNERWTEPLQKAALNVSVQNLSLLNLASGIVRRLAPASAQSDSASVQRRESAGELEGIAQDVGDVYMQNMGVAVALSEHFDFDILFYWQPTLFNKPLRSAFEQSEYDKVGVDLVQFFEAAYSDLLEDNQISAIYPMFRDLTSVFETVSEPHYIDWNHLGEDGNGLIAAHIAEDVKLLISTETNIR